MPSIELKIDELRELVGEKISIQELKENLSQIALDVEGEEDGVIKAEYNPNRPDYCTTQGVVRQLKGKIGLETGLPKFKVNKGSTVLTVDDSVIDVRPIIVCGIVRGVDLDHERIQGLMKIQEDLHWLVGRNRLKAAIGVHDMANITPPFKYIGVKPESVRFKPLGENREMNLVEILKLHPKGVEYAHLVNKYDRFPIILDCKGDVLSFPPIINGTLTQITEDTEDLFLDITGYSLSNVTMALNILSTELHDSGGILETVTVKYPDKLLVTPDLKPESMVLSKQRITETLGLKLTDDEIIDFLSRTRFEAKKIRDGSTERFKVLIPPYRFDILHEVDLIEEIAVGYGYDRLAPSHNYSLTIGTPSTKIKKMNQIRRILIGSQLLEVVNSALTNEEDQYAKMRIREDHVELLNPISNEYTMFRTRLIPGLLKILSLNKHSTMPQQIFEIGDVLKIDEGNLENMTRREQNIAIAIMDHQADFTRIKALSEALIREMGLKAADYLEATVPFLLEGRSAKVTVNGLEVGLIGEVHPQVLNNFDLDYPVCSAEFSLIKLEEALNTG